MAPGVVYNKYMHNMKTESSDPANGTKEGTPSRTCRYLVSVKIEKVQSYLISVAAVAQLGS
jgi:hypothetical protein